MVEHIASPHKARTRLSEGAYIELNLDGKASRIFSFVGAAEVEIEACEQASLLRLLLQGLPRRVNPDWLQQARQKKLVLWSQRRDDRLLSRRLDALGQARAWMRPTGQGGRLFARLYRAMLKAHSRRKVFVDGFGQTPCLPESSVRRAWCSRGRPGRVLCIGDDDLVSVALAMLGHKVDVVDIDGLVLIPLLQTLAREWQLPLRARVLDLCQPLPAPLRAGFDWVYTDPMSTPEGLGLFWSRALSALKLDGVLVSCAHAAATALVLQQVDRMGLAIAQHLADFNTYYNEAVEEDAYRSDLWLLHPTPRSRPLYGASHRASADIFAAMDQHRRHVWTEVRAGVGSFSERAIENVMSALIDYRAFGDVSWLRHQDGGARWYLAPLPGGGHVSIEIPARRDRIYISLFPTDEERENTVAWVLASRLPYTVLRYGQRVARPWIDIAAASS